MATRGFSPIGEVVDLSRHRDRAAGRTAASAQHSYREDTGAAEISAPHYVREIGSSVRIELSAEARAIMEAWAEEEGSV